MKDKISAFIYKIDQKNMAFILKNDQLIDTIDLDDITGNIYRGKILRELKALDGYEIDLGMTKKALLRKNRAFGFIKPSQDVLVQVLKVPDDKKLIEVSQKIYIENQEYRIIRSENGFNISKKSNSIENQGRLLTLEEEFKRLLKEEILLPSPKLIKEASIDKLLLPYEDIEFKNYSSRFESLYGIEKGSPDQVVSFSKAIEEYKSNKIKTTDGIELVIDKVEALTVIDINASDYISFNRKIDSYFINDLAINDIVRIIRFKSIKKMLIIDFLRMKKTEEKKALEKKFIECLKENRISYKNFGFTKMGLYEIIVH